MFLRKIIHYYIMMYGRMDVTIVTIKYLNHKDPYN